MSCINVGRQRHPVNGRARRVVSAVSAAPTGPGELQSFHPTHQSHALAFVIEADQGSIWPTHRIRSFLISQQSDMSCDSTN